MRTLIDYMAIVNSIINLSTEGLAGMKNYEVMSPRITIPESAEMQNEKAKEETQKQRTRLFSFSKEL